jgi:hypothetical protein
MTDDFLNRREAKPNPGQSVPPRNQSLAPWAYGQSPRTQDLSVASGTRHDARGGPVLSPVAIAAAQETQRIAGTPASVTLAQLLVESGGGLHMPPGSNNAFGVKASDGHPGVWAYTHEPRPDGTLERVLKKFRVFDSLADSFEDHAQLLARSPAYAKARAAIAGGVTEQSANDYANALTGVYGKSSSYGSALIERMQRLNLYQYDHPTPAAPVGPRPNPSAVPGAAGLAPNSPSPRADLSPYLQDASYNPGGGLFATSGQPGLPPQPGLTALAGRPPAQGQLNASLQGGVTAGMGGDLNGPGDPGALGLPPPGGFVSNARPPTQGDLNAPFSMQAGAGMGGAPTDQGAADPGDSIMATFRALGRPPGQGDLNAPPQGGLPTMTGDYLYGAGNPAARGGPPSAALALGARTPTQGDLNSPPWSATGFGPGGPPTDEDIQNLGYDNAVALSRMLGVRPAQAAPPTKSPSQMMADALIALRSGGQASQPQGQPSAAGPPAPNPLVAALMAMTQGGAGGTSAA